jgi:polygalacturonase
MIMIQARFFSIPLLAAFFFLTAPDSRGAAASHTFIVTRYGAAGDGTTADTAAINEAIAACAEAGGGQVLFPPGRYLSGTIHLRSHVHLLLPAGATVIGTTNLSEYQAPSVPSFMPEAKWGKWHRGLLVGENLEDVSITGPGEIDGNKVFDPAGEEHMRGPHTITFVNCRGFTLRDLSIVDSANYAVFFQASDNVEARNVKITGGWDGIHFRGAPNRWCHNVKIINSQFYTGDDSIAGRYWDNVVVSGCIVNSSCNGIRLIGPATRLLIDHCLFYGPGEQPHRSSKRNNMLSGIILQPGAWDKTEGLLDNVLITANTMRDVASPVTIWTRAANPVGSITISGLDATGVYRSALSIESWADAPITNVVIRNSTIQFAGGGKASQAEQPVKHPGVDARPLPAWGVYARNVERLRIEDVRLALAQDDLRPVILAESVPRLELDNVKYPRVEGIGQAVVTNNLGSLKVR